MNGKIFFCKHNRQVLLTIVTFATTIDLFFFSLCVLIKTGEKNKKHELNRKTDDQRCFSYVHLEVKSNRNDASTCVAAFQALKPSMAWSAQSAREKRATAGTAEDNRALLLIICFSWCCLCTVQKEHLINDEKPGSQMPLAGSFDGFGWSKRTFWILQQKKKDWCKKNFISLYFIEQHVRNGFNEIINCPWYEYFEISATLNNSQSNSEHPSN